MNCVGVVLILMLYNTNVVQIKEVTKLGAQIKQKQFMGNKGAKAMRKFLLK